MKMKAILSLLFVTLFAGAAHSQQTMDDLKSDVFTVTATLNGNPFLAWTVNENYGDSSIALVRAQNICTYLGYGRYVGNVQRDSLIFEDMAAAGLIGDRQSVAYEADINGNLTLKELDFESATAEFGRMIPFVGFFVESQQPKFFKIIMCSN